MPDRLEDVIGAALTRTQVEIPPGGGEGRIRLIALHGKPELSYEKMRLLQALVRERFHLVLDVIGGGYGCFTAEAEGSDLEGKKLREADVQRLVHDREFLALLRTIGYDLLVVHAPYRRVDLRLAGAEEVEEEPVDYLVLAAQFSPTFAYLRERLRMISPPATEKVLPSRNLPVMLWYPGKRPAGHATSPGIVVTCLPKMGNVPAAATTALLLRRLRPRKLILVGSAEAIDESLHEGDVVLADQVVHYDARRKERTDGTHYSPTNYHGDPSLLQEAKILQIEPEFMREWRADLAKESGRGTRFPELVIGDVASGDAAIDSRAVIDGLTRLNYSLLAVETEAAGVLEAARQLDFESNTLVVRGIANFANRGRDERAARYACQAASWFAGTFVSRLQTLPLDSEPGPPRAGLSRLRGPS